MFGDYPTLYYNSWSIVQTLMIVANGRMAARYHIGYPACIRASWGMWGSYMAVSMRFVPSVGMISSSMLMCMTGQSHCLCKQPSFHHSIEWADSFVHQIIWNGVNTFYAGRMVDVCLQCIWPSWANVKNTLPESSGITTRQLASCKPLILFLWV